ncbi:MAG: carboxypeptidase-like regulatory domain-containing protein [Bacteroidota bacterium]
MKNLLYISAFLILQIPLLTSQRTISGKVLDEQSLGLMAANCYVLDDITQAAFSDLDGSWTLELQSSDPNDTIVISYLGYETVMLPVDNFIDGPVTTILTTDEHLMTEVVVRAKRPVAEDFSVKKLDRMDIYFTPVAKGDPLNAIQMLPASTDTEESASPSLRGSEPGRTLVVVDGVPLRSPVKFTQLNGTGNFSIFTTEMIEHQHVFGGNPPLIYGNASAGLVDISLRRSAGHEGLALGASLGHISAQWSQNTGSDDSGYISVFANGSQSELFKRVNPGALDMINSFGSLDGGIRLHKKWNNNLSLSFYNYTATEDYDARIGFLSYQGDANGSQSRNISIARLEWMEDQHQFTINAGHNISASMFSLGSITSDVDREDVYTSLNYKYLSDATVLQGGLTYQWNSDRFREHFPVSIGRIEEGSPTLFTDALLSQHDIQPYLYAKTYIDDMIISGALRTNVPIGGQEAFLSRQLSAKYQPESSMHSLLVSAGKYHNYHYPTSGNVHQQLQTSTQYAVEYEYQSEMFRGALALYHKVEDNTTTTQDLILQQPPGTRDINGIEMSFQKSLGERWVVDLANTWLDVTVRDDELTYRGSNDLEYFVKAGITYFNNDVFNLGLSYMHRPGTYYTGIQGGFELEDQGILPVLDATPNGRRFGSYRNLSLTFNRSFDLSNDRSLVIYGVINNVFDTFNERSIQYSRDYSSSSFDSYGRRWLMIGGMLIL